MSERTLVDFVIATGSVYFEYIYTTYRRKNRFIDMVPPAAQSSKSPEALFSSLQAADIPSTDEARRFAYDLFARVPRKAKAASSEKAQRKREEAEMSKLRKANESYSLLLDDDEDDEDQREAKRLKKLKKKEKKLRKKDEEDKWADDEDNRPAVDLDRRHRRGKQKHCRI
jgi:pre-mRNA-splicing factor ATP-dependent RNA helicase DHX16